MEFHYFDCRCSDFGHTIRFTLDPEDGEIYLEIHLDLMRPWYKRWWQGIRYMFGKPASYCGNYDVTCLKPEDFPRLRALFDRVEEIRGQEHLQH